MSLRGVEKHFTRGHRSWAWRGDADVVRAVDGVDLDVLRGETLGIVGESGCGKSTLARLMIGLSAPTAGEVIFDGHSLGRIGRRELRRLRKRFQLVFQDPYSSLNPRRRVGKTVETSLRVHHLANRRTARARVQELLERVGLRADDYFRYPHEFSGGQRQRIGLARALAVEPDLIVADEPVSALDVSIQAQVLNLLMRLRSDLELTAVFIAHDIAVVRHVSDRIVVMYLGRVVELAAADDLCARPRHPYTEALLAAVPSFEIETDAISSRPLLAGDVPSPIHPPSGCRFHPRCPYATSICATEEPQLTPAGPGRLVACHHPRRATTDSAPEMAQHPPGG